MSPKIFAVMAVLILVAIGTSLYVGKQDRKDQIESADATPTVNLSTGGDGTIARIEFDATLERSVIEHRATASIFSDVPESELDHQLLEEIIRARPIGAYRIVRVDSDALRTKIRQSADVPGFDIQLLDSDPIKLLANTATEHSGGWQTGIGTWSGAVVGDETSRASFVVAPDSTVNGVVRTLKTGRIKIEPIKGSSHHIIWQWDPKYERNLD